MVMSGLADSMKPMLLSGFVVSMLKLKGELSWVVVELARVEESVLGVLSNLDISDFVTTMVVATGLEAAVLEPGPPDGWILVKLPNGSARLNPPSWREG